MGREFQVIPVIDLRHGVVVRARAGDRASYAPIATPLAKGSDPADIARALIAATGAATLYVADLDAIIDGTSTDLSSLARIAAACPQTRLWVDAGFCDAQGVATFLDEGLGRPVIGSESQTDGALVAALGDRAVLSLDTKGAQALGPASLHDDARTWPNEVIVMTLSSIGTGAGPDLARLEGLVASRPGRKFYAAGGVRGPSDVMALTAVGAAGALVASAIHDGTLGRNPSMRP
ncbi:HisA/HisF-related TIM barrel protein [uncultured Methylobacterium sp.]|uniref:HisA/HisF-related TIM barrel protein n=1 Tax=uncultured Methylobacterium sp. TaxID=157278 RepID=UPI0035CB6876